MIRGYTESFSNYPPGVTGNEPEITGIYPAEQVVDSCSEDLKVALDRIENALGFLDDQGALNRDLDKQGDKAYREVEELKRMVENMIPDEPGL